MATAQATPKRLIRIGDLCDKLGVSRTTVWKLRREPSFPEPIPLGGLTMYDEHEVDEWIEDQRGAHGDQ